MCYFFGWQIEIDRYIRSCLSQGGHSPGKPGKVKEFKSGQGKVSENRRSQGKCVFACGILYNHSKTLMHAMSCVLYIDLEH